MKMQKLLFLPVFFLATLLLSCQGSGSRQNDTSGMPESQPPPPSNQGLISHAGLLPGILDYEGQFLQAAQWPEQGSMWYTVVSQHEQGEFFTSSWVSRLHIYLFEVSGERILTRRAFQAESPNTYSTVELKGDRSQLTSLPSLGTVFSIVYTICPDGMDPCSIYSSVISAQGKYDFQVMENVDKSAYEEARDAMMAGIPEDVAQHMLEQLFD